VGRPLAVARMDSVRSGVVPVQPEQKRFRSTFVSDPLTDGVNAIQSVILEWAGAHGAKP